MLAARIRCGSCNISAFSMSTYFLSSSSLFTYMCVILVCMRGALHTISNILAVGSSVYFSRLSRHTFAGIGVNAARGGLPGDDRERYWGSVRLGEGQKLRENSFQWLIMYLPSNHVWGKSVPLSNQVMLVHPHMLLELSSLKFYLQHILH